ncbi:MAG TPA: M23 family metallopeptidase [Myxococcaceae bacterium]|nr:M23 family metallopeptidase [Myxococcaceae bacterium]
MRNTMLSLLSGLLALAAPGALAQAAVTPDGHFDWPLGLDEPSGLQRMGYGYSVMQKFHDPVYASADGVVACANDNQYDARRSYPGKVVVIRHRLPDGTTVYTQYGHLNFCAAGPQACAQPGDTLRRGQQIGTVVYQDYKDKDGNTINNTHLHFEVCDFDSTRP